MSTLALDLPTSTRSITLAWQGDLPGFRREARALLAAGVVPEMVSWHVADAEVEDLFADKPEPAAEVVEPKPAAMSGPPVPAAFIRLCESVALHSDPNRFGLLYRLLWRLTHDPALRFDPLDPDRVTADRMAHAVRRDLHKMTAFVRFRTVDDGGEGPLHVAWFEPDHHIVEAVAPFFVRRFTQMRWAILSPERCIRWDGSTLFASPGAKKSEAPGADGGEALWLTYYQSIFNPARLKLAMMTREMPRRYWKNLPEATLISELSAEASQREATMIEQPSTEVARRLPSQRMVPIHSADTAEPGSLAALAQATQRCRDCPIGALATQSVPGEGAPHAALMLVGEQPGDQEDLRGRPFVGPAGQLLDRAFAQLGWPRDALYLTNAVKHFKYELRGKRRIHKTASQREAAACLHWLEDEIALVKPKAIVALGATAARSLMGRAVPVMSERGQWLQRADGLRVLVTLHPSALLRAEPEQRDEAVARWIEDLTKASEVLAAPA